MNVHPAVISGAFAFFLFLIGLGMANLTYRLKQLEEGKVSNDTLELKIELIETKLAAIEHTMEVEQQVNVDAHNRLIKDAETTHSILADIKNRLSNIQYETEILKVGA